MDLVVASGQEAVEFLAGGDPWPGVPVLYADVSALTIDVSQALPGATGLVFEDHFRAALAVIKSLFPDTERVGLIHGASTGERSRFLGFAEQVRAAGLGLEPVDFSGLAMDDLLGQVAHLPEHTVLFLFRTQVDAMGRAFQPLRSCELISAAANRPLFSLPRHELGCGIVGGLLRDYRAAGRLLGEQALRRLDGETAPPPLVPMERHASLVFDARQVERWHVQESQLPPGSVLQFRQRGLWRDYRTQMTAGAGVVMLQSVLIAWLLLEHRRRRRAEREVGDRLEETRRQLVTITHLDRRAAMGEVTAAIAHELNQPLEAILHNAEAGELMLESGEASGDEMRQILADIRRIDLRAAAIIQGLRGLLRKKDFEAAPVDLNELTRETAALVMPVAGSKGVRLTVALAGGSIAILGDRIHIQQVLLNVLLNGIEAMQATPRECRQLDVSTLTRNQRVEVAVTDRGNGIPAGSLTQIFEPFYTTKGEGMGMGLSIAKTIVEAHGGSIAARNNPDAGATVWFTLPPAQRA